MLSLPHLVLLFIVALLVFGPDKLPGFARTVGKMMAEFRRISNDLRRVVEDEMREMDRAAREAEIRQKDAAAQKNLPGATPAGPPNSIGALPDAAVIAGAANSESQPAAEAAQAADNTEPTPIAPPGTVPGERPNARNPAPLENAPAEAGALPVEPPTHVHSQSS